MLRKAESEDFTGKGGVVSIENQSINYLKIHFENGSLELCSEPALSISGGMIAGIFVDDPDSIEIIDLSQNSFKQLEEKWRRAWQNNKVYYKGRKFINSFAYALKQKESEVFQKTQFTSHQQVYLGYILNHDTFVIGWDCWIHTNEGGQGHLAMFKFDEGELQFTAPSGNVTTGHTYHKMFYDVAYHALHKQYPDLLDLKID